MAFFLKFRDVGMRSRRTALVVLVAIVFATPVVRCAPTGEAPRASMARSFGLNYLPVLSDFDGDRRLDQAELHLAGTHHCIRVRFGNTREIHLDFGTRTHSSGMLLVRDANRDSFPDLIWVYRSRSEPAVIWLNDGAGHFAESNDGSRDVTADSLFGETDYAETGRIQNKETCLAPVRPSSEFAQSISLDLKYLRTVVIPRHNLRRDPGLYLSCLRERGPPPAV